jgi:phosphoribosylanthranilate isomerase
MLIKICCIQSEGEVEMALVAGATHLGLVASMPSGPGPFPDEQIASLVRVLPTHATPGLLTSRTHPEQIIQHVRSTGARAVQIVQEVPVAVRNAVRGGASGRRHPPGPAHHRPRVDLCSGIRDAGGRMSSALLWSFERALGES